MGVVWCVGVPQSFEGEVLLGASVCKFGTTQPYYRSIVSYILLLLTPQDQNKCV